MMYRSGFAATALTACALVAATGCSEQTTPFSTVKVIDSMAQTIGGPAAAGRPGDFLLQNDLVRAIVHGRHNQRSTFPISNGSLVDLDLQRPQARFFNGRGRDAFYEMNAMLNLKVGTSVHMSSGRCGDVGAAPCPTDADGQTLDCARVSAAGPGEDFIGVIGLLDFAIKKQSFDSNDLELVSDYDLCPGEPTVRTTTTVRFFGKGDPKTLPGLTKQTSLLDALLGETVDIDCAPDPALCPAGSECVDLLINLSVGTLKTEMKRCRRPDQKLAGIIAGDFMLFSGKVKIFIPGSGFDHETYTRSVFDSGGDIFSAPLSLDFVAAVGPDVSYVYYAEGLTMIPVFSGSFTVSMTNTAACAKNDPNCLKGKEMRFHRFVSVGQGDVASALAGYYKMRGIKTGRLEGFVVDARYRKPVSDMNVFAFKVPKAWEKLSSAELAQKHYDELVALNVKETTRPKLPLGEQGVVSQFRSDVGVDMVKDGSFGGQLPPGRYLLVARDVHVPPSRLVPVTIAVGETTHTTVVTAEPGMLQFSVLDEAGRAMPNKLTIGVCMPECARDGDCAKVAGRPFCNSKTELCVPNKDGSYNSARECRPDQTWDGTTCTCPLKSRLPLELGGGRYADNTIRTIHSKGGHGLTHLPPGTYQFIASRGFEYTVDKRFITLHAGLATRQTFQLRRVIDTSGWISADFHIHGPNSVDSGLTHKERVISYAAEGVELMSSSDHEQLTDYGPTIYKLGLRPWINSQVGVEISPLDYGHFLGFPLRFDERANLNGAFYWRVGKGAGVLPKPPVNDWENMPPKVIFDNMRERGKFGPENTVVAVPHFYDHFQFYGVDPWTLELPGFSVNALLNRVLTPAKFSGEMDAVEAMNGKNFDVLRRPTWKEVREYNIALTKVLGDTSRPYADRLADWAVLSKDAQRQFMIRTPAEQKLAISYNNPSFQCRCAADVDCGKGFICEQKTGACLNTCTSDTSCDEKLAAAGREKCLPVDGDASRTRCQRVTPSCDRTAQCGQVWAGHPEACIAVDASKPNARTCEVPCAKDLDCSGDPLRPSCISGRCQASKVVAASDNDPCPTVRGTVDDWFQMLNHGVHRTVLGNSDSHDVYYIEAGIPRNYVRSSSDIPGQIQSLSVAQEIKRGHSFATTGPFVDFSIDGKGMGDMLSAPKGQAVHLSIRVRSPLWFDVDRIEVYRNGDLFKVVSGSTDCKPGDDSCIKVPNDAVTNYEATITDTPTRDAWYVVIAMGVNGKSLVPVYSSTPVSRLGIFELIQRLTPLLPPLRSLRTPFSPTISLARPYAITNPVWVDTDGDGMIKPIKNPPSWATAKDRQLAGIKTSALSQPSAASTPSPAQQKQYEASPFSHDHRIGLGRLRRVGHNIKQLLRAGKLTKTDIQRAIESLRYLRSR